MVTCSRVLSEGISSKCTSWQSCSFVHCYISIVLGTEGSFPKSTWMRRSVFKFSSGGAAVGRVLGRLGGMGEGLPLERHRPRIYARIGQVQVVTRTKTNSPYQDFFWPPMAQGKGWWLVAAQKIHRFHPCPPVSIDAMRALFDARVQKMQKIHIQNHPKPETSQVQCPSHFAERWFTLYPVDFMHHVDLLHWVKWVPQITGVADWTSPALKSKTERSWWPETRLGLAEDIDCSTTPTDGYIYASPMDETGLSRVWFGNVWNMWSMLCIVVLFMYAMQNQQQTSKWNGVGGICGKTCLLAR